MVYLKRNILIFLRTLRIFIYDPLVEWQKSRGRETANDIKTKKATGEVTNEEVSKKNDLPIEILEELRMSKQRVVYLNTIIFKTKNIQKILWTRDRVWTRNSSNTGKTFNPLWCWTLGKTTSFINFLGTEIDYLFNKNWRWNKVEKKERKEQS